jgi:antitoxin component of MazEF toxin-antitoxin module
MSYATVRRVGNSLGIVIPKAEAQKLKLHEGDRVEVEFHKAAGIESIFGLLKGQMGDIDTLMRELDEDDDA